MRGLPRRSSCGGPGTDAGRFFDESAMELQRRAAVQSGAAQRARSRHGALKVARRARVAPALPGAQLAQPASFPLEAAAHPAVLRMLPGSREIPATFPRLASISSLVFY